MKNVQIIDKLSGQIIAEYPIFVDLIDDPVDQDFMNDAWDIAVEEGLVDDDDRKCYKLEILSDIPLDHSSDSL
ncbi:hypothetical protein [Nitrosomonas ureae]|uniref:Uncharacterized protein n=1 Tax=Nitrosomonas ureae TaxID=44577 RepID=A0A2T5ISV8_9PROT|nr:hypothetical protein [Nitrosomonas ureae]PTQ86906.1 hypothetical protein C8R28_1008101 [Nitrosomonas ureae]